MPVDVTAFIYTYSAHKQIVCVHCTRKPNARSLDGCALYVNYNTMFTRGDRRGDRSRDRSRDRWPRQSHHVNIHATATATVATCDRSFAQDRTE